MIILDENIHDIDVRTAIERWYPGQVLSVTKLRPQSTIKDEALPTLLRQAQQPTFVTINVNDFWRTTLASPDYCIVTLELIQERVMDIPDYLRGLLRRNEFKTKAAPMGKVIHWTPARIEYYEFNRRIIRIDAE